MLLNFAGDRMTTSDNPVQPGPESFAALRHALATLAYRGAKVIRGAPQDFAAFNCGSGCRSAGAVLAHINDLLDWALSMAMGQCRWHDSRPGTWEQETARFHEGLQRFDAYISSGQPLHASPKELFQGPIADALTHVGQLAMMRRLAGAPVKGENYFAAEITAGRLGPEQPAPKREF